MASDAAVLTAPVTAREEDQHVLDWRQAEPGSATELAYNGIIDLILTRNLRPGERTSVNLLATQLKLGRAPVKQAIDRLETEGMFTIKGRSGTTVTTVDAEGAVCMFALRGALEDLAAQAAVKTATQADLAAVERLIREMRQDSIDAPFEPGAGSRFVKANSAFHHAVVAAAHNPYLTQAYSRLQLQLQIITYLSHRGYDPIAAARRQNEHEEIAAALIARDAQRLAKAQRDHSATTERSLLAYLKQQ
ncbi:MAG TPA: GntR family transcriptional regulator [Stellaceae bacterium]|nr:GntR family transcriptional regulator [Stellaceae bacterium]